LDALGDAESKSECLRNWDNLPEDSLEYGLGYSFSFFCKNAVSKSIGRGRIIVEFFSAETFVKV